MSYCYCFILLSSIMIFLCLYRMFPKRITWIFIWKTIRKKKKKIRRVLIINNVYSKHRCLKSTRWIRTKIFKKVSVTVITEISIHLLISNGTTNIFFYLMIPLKILGILHITCPKSKRFRGIQMFISIMTFDAFHKIIKFSYQDLNTLFELNSFLTIS